jgi:endo-1,4-beta-xylanase
MKNSLHPILPALLTAALLAAGALAQDKKLPEGKALLKPGLDAFGLHSGPNAEGEVKLIDVAGQPFKQAIRGVVKQRPAESWHTQVNCLLTQPVKRGDVALISFHARSPESKNYGGKGLFMLYLGTPETDLEVTFSEEISVGKEWKHYQIPVTLADNYEPAKGMLNFDFGFDPQTLELADLKLTSYGREVKESDLPRSGW